MSTTENEDDFYNRLKKELAKSTKWPSDYLYKFIVASDTTKINEVETIFDNTGAVIQTKQSSNGKYTSISITVNLKNPEAVIEKYKQVSKIKDVISL